MVPLLALALPVLYPRTLTHEASPKAISRRTSYLRARLAFHRYPQVILQVFNLDKFGPPRTFTYASACPWIDRPVSGLPHVTESPYSDSLSLRLRGRPLNLRHVRVTRRLIMQKARGHNPKIAPTLCKHTVSGTISLPAQGYFSPFPHGTCSLSVVEEYLALGGGPPRFRQNSTCSAVLGNAVQRASSLSPTGLLPSPVPLSRGVRLAEEVFYSSRAPSSPPTAPHNTGLINDDGL